MSTYRLAISIAVVIFFVAGLAQPAIAQDGSRNRTPYLINAGDRLEIAVWKEPDLQREVLVRPDGAFSFPLAGDVHAKGRTVSEIAAEITQRLESFIPGLVVTVTVADIGGNKIFVIGQVNRPGEFVVNPRVDVMQALSMAGGMTAFAELNDIKILRRSGGRQTVFQFRYGDVEKGQKLEQNIMLEVGDVVVVP